MWKFQQVQILRRNMNKNHNPTIAPEKPKIKPVVKPVRKPLPEEWNPTLPKKIGSPKGFLKL